MPAAPETREEEARLTGARAEFASSLPRRLETLRSALQAAEQEPGDADRVKGLLRRVHAVGSAARVLGFASVAEALAEAERCVRQAAASGKPTPFDEVGRAFDLLPSLVLGAPVATRGPEQPPAADALSSPASVLVVGPMQLVTALTDGDKSSIECERVDDASRVLELAHIVGPDVVLVDADHPGARDAVAKVLADEELRPTPVLVVGSFDKPEAAAAFVQLGAARVLQKPATPDMLRRAVDELRARAAEPRAVREPLGELSVQGLAERIAVEFKRGLVDALQSATPQGRVQLGDGNDVLAAVWGAVARVRELVTVRSGGSLRFEPTGPEGGVPFAPWGGGDRRAGERGRARARDAEGVSLQGRRIVVADDDPAVVWFMAEILRSVGAEVLEAHDGKRALDLAFETWPDAVVSDVLMPKLDGFSLCHELRRDVALRDVPVILLSWKEDLLQRVRELGADADGYLRKEATAAAVVERVREILRARARVEERINAGGEVRGRLDGLTPRLILELACRGERDVRLSVRDAAFLFEGQVRRGRLVSLTRSAPDGSFVRGPAVLPSLLGVSAGRFTVEPDATACRNELSGSLFELLKDPIAKARAALAAVSAGALLELERVELERVLAEAYLACTPEPAAGALRRLLEGQSARELVTSGVVSPRLLEAVLSDLARRGALLSFDSPVVSPTLASADVLREPEARREGPGLAELRPDPIVPLVAPPPAPAAEHAAPAESEPKAEGGAVETMRTEPLRVEGSPATLPLDPEPTPAQAEPMLSFGPTSSTLDGVGGVVPEVKPNAEPVDAPPEPELGAHLMNLMTGSDPPPVAQRIDPGATLRSSDPPRPLSAAEQAAARPVSSEADEKRRPTEPPARARAAEPEPPSGTPASVGKLVLRSAIAGALAFGVTTWLLLPLLGGDKDSLPTPGSEKPAPESPAPPVTVAPKPSLAHEELAPPPGIELAPGQGIIEVDSSGPEPIYVDDAFVGLGPLRRISAPAGTHHVELKSNGTSRRIDFTLSAGKRARVSQAGTAPAPSATGTAR